MQEASIYTYLFQLYYFSHLHTCSEMKKMSQKLTISHIVMLYVLTAIGNKSVPKIIITQ